MYQMELVPLVWNTSYNSKRKASKENYYVVCYPKMFCIRDLESVDIDKRKTEIFFVPSGKVKHEPCINPGLPRYLHFRFSSNRKGNIAEFPFSAYSKSLINGTLYQEL